MDTIAERLKFARKEKGLMQKEVAQFCDMTQSNISDYERGQANPPINVLRKISQICGVSFVWLATGEGSMHAIDSKSSKFNKELFKKAFIVSLDLLKKLKPDYTSEEAFDLAWSIYVHAVLQHLEAQEIEESLAQKVLRYSA